MTDVCAAGIDVGRDYLDVALAPSGRVFRMSNTDGGVSGVIARLRRAGAGRVVLESIGGYATRLVRALAAAGFAVGIVIPSGFRPCAWRKAGAPRPIGWTRNSSRASLC